MNQQYIKTNHSYPEPPPRPREEIDLSALLSDLHCGYITKEEFNEAYNELKKQKSPS